jgi:tetrahydromethanopterin S-methyltransferase subunit A
MMKLAAEPDGDAQTQALEAVAAYTQTFNKMRFIETEERDEIYMALRDILDALPGDMLQKDALIAKFDELHDF